MKKILTLIAMFTAFAVTAQNINTPAPSPKQTVTQEFGLSEIKVEYSRPAMRGRTIFGDLVPYGKVWRTGANRPTAVTFGSDVMIAGNEIKAGTYNLVTIPDERTWTIKLLNTDMNAFNYKEGSDVASFVVESVTMPVSVENFTIMFDNQTSNSVEFGMMWDDVYASFTVTADVDSDVMGQIDRVMNNDMKPYFAAASYYFDNGKDMDKALEWAQKAVEQQPKAYWVRHLLAKVQAKTGNTMDAMKTAKESMEMAREAGNMDYVRLNEKLLKGMK